ncbi:Methyltransferase protein 13 [Fasciola hepatica]|uniref:Methyltransferase protein 13 n=1 Tax=Fasciola hepatica TaxID=6192 RepID=A0A4E0QTB7_FASHE|nr:Methyltransferase protein 13 [Fasciola hepatica]
METLLPKTTEDFNKREYWERFFQSRQNTFEWYGDFLQHSRFFTKYIRKADRALVVGCGNSDLGLMIFEKLNVGDVTNIDISETIIRQMRQKHCSRKIRAGLTYECMDVFTIEDNIKSGRMHPFSCVLDKGTLDAIHSGDNSDSDATNMFRNIDSALSLMGRYIILTLAQEHIVHSICNYFIQG